MKIDGTDFDKHAKYMIRYFDEVDADDKLDDFMSNCRQQSNESVRIWKQQYDEQTDVLMEKGLLISFEDDKEEHNKQQARNFYFKLNSVTKKAVRKKMKSKSKTIDECNIEELFDWALESEE